MSEPRPIGAIEENVFDLIAADFTCLARIADAQGMTPELEAIADAFDANLVGRIAAVLDRFQGIGIESYRAALTWADRHSRLSSSIRARGGC